MSVVGFTLFDTALGPCAIAWSPRGIVGFWLPDDTPEKTRARVLRRHPEAPLAQPSPEAADAIAKVCDLLDGGAPDLGAVSLDDDGVPDLHRQVYAVVRAIPIGKTMTYGEVAKALGDASLAQAVGQAM